MPTTSDPKRVATAGAGDSRLGPLRIEAPELPSSHRAVKRPYHCGVLPDARSECVHANGFDFPLMEGARFDAAGDPVEINDGNRGKIHHMTDAEAEVCLERIGGKWVRFRPNNCWDTLSTVMGTKPEIVDGKPTGKQETVPNPRFNQRRGDVPLGCFVYMVRLSDGETRRSQGEPPPLVARDKFEIQQKRSHQTVGDVNAIFGTT